MTMSREQEVWGMNMAGKHKVNALMIMGTILLLFVGGVMFSFPSKALAAGMDMKSIAEKEVIKVDKDGKEYPEFVSTEAVEVIPGDTLRFTNIYRNLGDEPAEPGLTINNPVPEGVVYIGGSATGNDASITFSVDGGKSFKAPAELFVTGEDGKKRLARPEEYTDIKWVVLKAILPGEEGAVAYKGRLK